jgi:hypothetical protein
LVQVIVFLALIGIVDLRSEIKVPAYLRFQVKTERKSSLSSAFTVNGRTELTTIHAEFHTKNRFRNFRNRILSVAKNYACHQEESNEWKNAIHSRIILTENKFREIELESKFMTSAVVVIPTSASLFKRPLGHTVNQCWCAYILI